MGRAGQCLLVGAPPWGYQPARAAKSSLSAATPRGSLESHDQTDTTGFRVVIWPKSGQTWVLARASKREARGGRTPREFAMWLGSTSTRVACALSQHPPCQVPSVRANELATWVAAAGARKFPQVPLCSNKTA